MATFFRKPDNAGYILEEVGGLSKEEIVLKALTGSTETAYGARYTYEAGTVVIADINTTTGVETGLYVPLTEDVLTAYAAVEEYPEASYKIAIVRDRTDTRDGNTPATATVRLTEVITRLLIDLYEGEAKNTVLESAAVQRVLARQFIVLH